MQMAKLNVNKKDYEVDSDPSTPLLWVLRDDLGLTGTKFGCGIAQCGACTVHVDGRPVRSCITPLRSAEGKKITTIEGLADGAPHELQKAWVEKDVPQCGYCQSGQIMAAVELLKNTPKPTDADIDSAIEPIICRCSTYTAIRKAIHLAAELKAKGGDA